MTMKNHKTQHLLSEMAPEHVIEAEKAVLGALLIDVNAFTEIDSILTPEMFDRALHRSIFTAMKQLYDQNKSIDYMTVFIQMKLNNQLPLNGNPSFLTELVKTVHSSLHILSHADIIHDEYYRRMLVQLTYNLYNQAMDYTNDPNDLSQEMIDSLQEINKKQIRSNASRSVGEIIPEAVVEIEKRCKDYQSGKISGINTGLTELDAITNGWQNSSVIVLAGRPGMGKTALMLHFAKYAAISGSYVLIYSLEMSRVSLVERLISKEADVDTNNFRIGNLSVDEMKKINSAIDKLKNFPIYIDDKPVITMGYIRNHAKMMKRNNKCNMICIDYLQLADMKGEANRNREQEVAQASRMAKIIAKELNIPVMLLSQLSREVEKRGNQEPKLSDLRESGAIEQDADIVMFAFRPSKAGIEFDANGIDMKGLGKIYVEKHRNGPTGVVNFSTNDSLTKIWDYKQV